MAKAADSKALSQQRYTEYAEGYVTSETHAKGSDLDRLLAIAEPQAHWQVLDIATGGGHRHRRRSYGAQGRAPRPACDRQRSDTANVGKGRALYSRAKRRA